MLHLTGSDKDSIFAQAKIEIQQMYHAGVDAVLVENYLGKPDDMERALEFLQVQYPDHIYGVNVLGDHHRAFRMAKKYHASFIQIDSICGHLPPDADEEYAEELSELRDDSIFLMGGVRFKYHPVLSGRSLDEDLMLGIQRCDGIVVTGEGTGVATEMEKIRLFREILCDYPLIVGAGMTLETCQQQLSVADGAIVGSYFKEDGITVCPVDPARVTCFMEKVREIRQNCPIS